MGHKKKTGKCRICGREGTLTFEHVPPGATYNKHSAKIVTLLDWIKAEADTKALPWEIPDVKGPISQKGRGDYYLCQSCNNNTGSWYGPHYKRFIDALMYVHLQIKDSDFKGVQIELTGMRPLPIFKQIIAMFCDTIPSLTERDPSIKEFLLDKGSKDFNTKKYKVYMYMLSGGFEKVTGEMAKMIIGERDPILLAEISSVPAGFILYIDLPEFYKPAGTNITNFIKCDYDDSGDITLGLNIFENNTIFPEDFRSKEEIVAVIEKNKQKDALIDLIGDMEVHMEDDTDGEVL